MNDTDKAKVTGVLTLGADRATAAAYVGRTLDELHKQVEEDEQFGRDVRQAEAHAEVAHLKAVHDAAGDSKNWRASTWWLQAHHPDRYARKPNQVSEQQLNDFVERIVIELHGVIPKKYHAAAVAKLRQIADQL